MKRLFYSLIVLGLCVAAGFTWQHFSKSKSSSAASAPAVGGPPRGLPVKAEMVRKGAIVDSISAVGTMLAQESVMIRPEIDSRIVSIHFQEGQLVHKGDLLVTLDAAESEAQLASAIAAANLNRSRLKRSEELQAKNFISAQALDEARENLNQTAARESELRAKLLKSTIRAPFDGVTGLRQVSPGAYVKAGQDMARLEGIGSLKLDFRIPELYLRKIRVGLHVAITMDAFPQESFSGVINAIEPGIDEATRTVLIRARVANPTGRLKPGLFARVELTLARREQALIISEQAIMPRGSECFVYVIEEGKVRLVPVELGLRRPGEVEIVKGLTAGQSIVIDGQLKLQDGAPVMVLPAVAAHVANTVNTVHTSNEAKAAKAANGAASGTPATSPAAATALAHQPQATQPATRKP